MTTAKPYKLYLAGPDVFRADSDEWGRRLEDIAAEHGFHAMYPADTKIIGQIDKMRDDGVADSAIAHFIFIEDVKMITECHGVLANLDSFRGPEMDPGTAFEVGFAAALGVPVWGYTSDRRPYDEKVAEWNGAPLKMVGNTLFDRDDMSVDTLGEPVNLMISRALVEQKVYASIQDALIAAAQFFIKDMRRRTAELERAQ